MIHGHGNEKGSIFTPARLRAIQDSVTPYQLDLTTPGRLPFNA
jgi:hypothetical protein